MPPRRSSRTRIAELHSARPKPYHRRSRTASGPQTTLATVTQPSDTPNPNPIPSRPARPQLFYIFSKPRKQPSSIEPFNPIWPRWETCTTFSHYRQFLKKRLHCTKLFLGTIQPAKMPVPGLEVPRTFRACDELLDKLLGMVYDRAMSTGISLEGKTTKEVAYYFFWFKNQIPTFFLLLASRVMSRMDREWFVKAEVEVPRCFEDLEDLMGQLGVTTGDY
ncbi:hypothetical protein BJ508DRAFT_334141 [Ascobolus immersus RN42]|uniref:Uncharacterized protein n=1 Tax=Ascobolus immersus RN42 TaxID=1160509 RepID=A0A3N4HUP6_ASCIM|nr:hypothetical protein BJ508DRAFT_334141 [Ascobolus immersus RN42]